MTPYLPGQVALPGTGRISATERSRRATLSKATRPASDPSHTETSPHPSETVSDDYSHGGHQ